MTLLKPYVFLSLLVISLPAWAASGVTQEDPSFAGSFVQMLAALALVLGLLLGLYWFMRKFTPGQIVGGKNSHLKVLGRLSLAPKRWVVLVEIGPKILALGMSDKDISLLTIIEDENTVSELKNNVECAGAGDLKFSKMLKQLLSNRGTQK